MSSTADGETSAEETIAASRPSTPSGQSIRNRVSAQARQHGAFLAVFGLAALLRAAASWAYQPALTFTDSWAYLIRAQRGPLSFEDDRPNGYPLLIRALTGNVGQIQTVTIFQHLAGLSTGLFVYIFLQRLGVRRWLAVSAAALILLNGHMIANEQYVATESFFTLAIVAATYLAIFHRENNLAMVGSGFLVGFAATLRAIGLVALPIWFLYALWSRRRLVPALVVTAALALPPALHGLGRVADGRSFGLTGDDGWAWYGRIGNIASCRGVRVPAGTELLCDDPVHQKGDPDFYVWNLRSPAYRVAQGEAPWETPTHNAKLRAFAFAVIKARPLSYLRVVAQDFFGFFTPGYGTVQFWDTFVLPRVSDTTKPDWLLAFEDRMKREGRPTYQVTIRQPADFLHHYPRFAHVPRWLLAILTAAAIASLALPRRNGRLLVRAAIVLALTYALVMLLTTVAINEFGFRLMLPSVPLLVIAGVLGIEELVVRTRLRDRSPDSAL